MLLLLLVCCPFDGMNVLLSAPQTAAKAVSDLSRLPGSAFIRSAFTTLRGSHPLELHTPFAGMPIASLQLIGSDANAAEPPLPWWVCANLFALTSDGQYLVSGGYWDSSFKLTTLGTGSTVQSLTYHTDVVTCVAMASLSNTHSIQSTADDAFVTPKPADTGRHRRDSSGSASVLGISSPTGSSARVSKESCRDVLVTGSLDTTVLVWEVIDGVVSPSPKHILHGHDTAVSCVAVLPGYDLIASGSHDGTVILHSLRKGQYLRTIVPTAYPEDVEVTPQGSVLPVVSQSAVGGSSATLDKLTSSASSSATPRVMTSPGSVSAKAAGGGSRHGTVGWVGISNAGVVAIYTSSDGVLWTFR